MKAMQALGVYGGRGDSESRSPSCARSRTLRTQVRGWEGVQQMGGEGSKC